MSKNMIVTMEDIENLKIEVEQLKEENEHLKAIKNIDDVLLALREKKQPSDGDSHMRQLLKNAELVTA